MTATTRFFCRCGRLLTVEGSLSEVVCPSCAENHRVGRDTASGGETPILSLRDGELVGPYRLEGLLGQGGMGAVHRAVDERDGRAVALKLLHPSLRARPDFVSRFRREARAAAELDHPNIVRVLDFGIEDGVPFLAMELLEGRSLLAEVAARPVLEAEIVDWMAQTAAGLRAAAERGIIHRDVKPTNLVLVDGPTVKVADFGLAKSAGSESHLTLTGEVLGTPHYMSPEQGQGAKVDARSDLYSLGASYYHLLAGEPPFRADTPVAVIMRHVQEEPQPLRSRAPRVSAELEGVIHRLLQKRPQERYPGYRELLQDLDRVKRGQTPRLRAEPPQPRVQSGSTTYVLPPAERTELLLRPASALRRALGVVVDLSIVEGLTQLLAVSWATAVSASLPGVRGDWNFLGPLGAAPRWDFAAIALAIVVLYFGVADGRGGRSFGKRRLRLRVCRRNGHDLGALRTWWRTALALPGLVLLSPTLTASALRVTELDLSTSQTQCRVAALGWIVLGWLAGRLAGTRPLHDLLSGADVYRADPRPQVAGTLARRPPSAQKAFLLSALPGVGLLYAGQWMLGLVAMAGIPVLLIRDVSTKTLLAAWLASGIVAASSAARRAGLAREAAQELDRTTLLRREE